MAAATSGNYERYVEIDGVRYAHVLDPRTGVPVRGMAGVTVLAENATQADALSTALYVLGIQEGQALARRMPGCGALFVPDRRPIEIHVTQPLLERFAPQPDMADRIRVIR